jgi:hypothetical protein
LQGIKNHFREFLYDFALKRNKLPGFGEKPAGAGNGKNPAPPASFLSIRLLCKMAFQNLSLELVPKFQFLNSFPTRYIGSNIIKNRYEL